MFACKARCSIGPNRQLISSLFIVFGKVTENERIKWPKGRCFPGCSYFHQAHNKIEAEKLLWNDNGFVENQNYFSLKFWSRRKIANGKRKKQKKTNGKNSRTKIVSSFHLQFNDFRFQWLPVKSKGKRCNSPEAPIRPQLFCTRFGLTIWVLVGECKNVVESTKLPTKLSTAVNCSCLIVTIGPVDVWLLGLLLLLPTVVNCDVLDEPAAAAVCDCVWWAIGELCNWPSLLFVPVAVLMLTDTVVPPPVLFVEIRVKRISDNATDRCVGDSLLLSGKFGNGIGSVDGLVGRAWTTSSIEGEIFFSPSIFLLVYMTTKTERKIQNEPKKKTNQSTNSDRQKMKICEMNKWSQRENVDDVIIGGKNVNLMVHNAVKSNRSKMKWQKQINSKQKN